MYLEYRRRAGKVVGIFYRCQIKERELVPLTHAVSTAGRVRDDKPEAITAGATDAAVVAMDPKRLMWIGCRRVGGRPPEIEQGFGVRESTKTSKKKPRARCGRWTIPTTRGEGNWVRCQAWILRVNDKLLLTITITMSDYNNNKLRTLSQPSQPQRQQQKGTTTNPAPLSALDIPSSDLDLGSIIAPSELDSPNPEQWAELDFQSRKRGGS